MLLMRGSNHPCSDGESTRRDGESSDCKITAGNRPGGELTMRGNV